MAVQLIGVPLGAEGDEHRQGAEVVDVVVDGPDAEGAQIGNDHGAVEGAGLCQRLRQPAEIVQHPQHGNGKAQQETGQTAQRVSDLLGIVVVVRGLDLLDLLVHLPVHIKDGVRRLKIYLDGGLAGIQAHAALDRHHNGNLVSGVDAAPGHKAVDPGQHGHTADIGRDQEMKDADALVAIHPQAAKIPVQHRNLKALLILVAAIVAGGHNEGDKLVECRQRADEPAILSVTKAALICTHSLSHL